MPDSKKIVAVLSDLMFTVKIQEAAKRAGVEVTFIKDSPSALRKAKEQPALIILDLNADSIAPLQLIEELKTDPDTRGIPLLGYLSHVQADLKMAAQQRGCDFVIARSAFSHNLLDLLERHAK
jgi:CheY-like chemotaxis protein